MSNTEKSVNSLVTMGPIPGSKKIYVKGKLHNISVAMREIELSDTVDTDGNV